MQNAMGGSAKCKVSIEEGRTGLRAGYSANSRNLAGNARIFGVALRGKPAGITRTLTDWEKHGSQFGIWWAH